MVGLTAVAGFAALVGGYSAVRSVGTVVRGLLESDERYERARANAEVLLERSSDEVGSVVDFAAARVEHERPVLQRVLDARERAPEAERPAEARGKYRCSGGAFGPARNCRQCRPVAVSRPRTTDPPNRPILTTVPESIASPRSGGVP